MSWRARNGFDPRRSHQASSCGRGNPSRLTRVLAEPWCSTTLMRVPCRPPRPGRLVALGSGGRTDLRGTEEKTDLACRGIGRIRAVHDVGLDALRQVCSNGPGRGFLRVGRTHDLAVPGDRVLALEDLGHHRSGGHVADQVLIERTLPVHLVEELRLLAGEPEHARCDDLQALGLEPAIDLAYQIAGHAVGFDNGQGALERHRDLRAEKWPAV